MTINNITVVSVPVSDQERAKAFYVDTLGFEVREDQSKPGMRWVLVAPKAATTAVTLVTWFDSMPAGSLHGLVLSTDDVRGDYERLLASGVEFDQPPTDEPWGVIEAVLRDPDGNRLILQQPTT